MQGRSRLAAGGILSPVRAARVLARHGWVSPVRRRARSEPIKSLVACVEGESMMPVAISLIALPVAGMAVVGTLVWAGSAHREGQRLFTFGTFVVAVAVAFALLGLSAAGGSEQFLDLYR